MANVIINDTHLTNIANAIREQNGTASTYLPSEMAAAITSLPTGGGTIPAFTLSGNCSYLFESGKLTWLIEQYKDQLSTDKITSAVEMFARCGMVDIPITLNLYQSSGDGVDITGMFRDCIELQTPPTLEHDYTIMDLKGEYLFYNCNQLKNIPSNFLDTNNSRFTNFRLRNAFTNCYCLRSIAPVLAYKRSDTNSGTGEGSYIETFMNCQVLDEVKNLPIVYAAEPMFTNIFTGCYRLKSITFERKNNTTPYEALWNASTVLDLSAIGFLPSNTNINIMELRGISATKNVYDAETYEELKNDADWFTKTVAYSRYNKTSAIETISTLPIVSTATIKFNGSAGSLTDGGAINTMTEEEIAVAAAKGWTVALV